MRYLVTMLSLVFLAPVVGADLRPVPVRGEETNLAEIFDSCDHSEPQVAARGTEGFLAVWLNQSNVVARRIGADGFPTGPEIAVSQVTEGARGRAFGPQLARLSDGNFVVTWLSLAAENRRDVLWRRLAEDGTPAGAIQSAVTLGPSPTLGVPALAASTDGFFAIVWSELDPSPSSPTRLGIRGRIFNNSGSSVGATRIAATITGADSRYRSAPQLAAAMTSGSSVLVGWTRPGDHAVLVNLLGGGTQPQLLYVGAPTQQDQGVSMVPVQGGVLVTYKSIAFGTGTTALVQKLKPNGDLTGTPFYWPLPLIIGVPTLAAEAGGQRAALQWIEPTQPFDTEASYALLLNSDGHFLDPNVFAFRLDDPTTETFGAQHHLTAISLTFAPGGKLAATWQVWRENPFLSTPCDDGVAVRVQTFELDEETVETPPDPPAGPYLSSPAVPGFRYKVRFSGSLLGSSESDCLAQTGCVSGAVAGRAEVLLRVIGPRPNGRLWPTIVRFTPSQVEVWIEQIATGTRLYYVLPAVDPEGGELGGRIDREGFPVP